MTDLPAPGDRIRLVLMPDDFDPIEPGATGTVMDAQSTGICVDWDNGRTLSLLPEVDKWETT